MFINIDVGKLRVFYITICLNMMSFCVGVYIGWTSPMVPRLRDQTIDSPLSFPVNPEQEGWISSLPGIGSFLACLYVGPLATAIGRKYTILLSSFFIIIAYVILILTNDIWSIYVARLLQGLGGGGGFSMIPMYIGEIAPDDIRGALGSLITVFILGGILFTYIIGPKVSYLTFQYCALAALIFFFLTFSFMPESPYYFAIKGRTEDLVNSLKILRGKNKIDVDKEKYRIQKEVEDSMSNKVRLIDIVQNRACRKAAFIVLGLLFFQQLTGTTAVTFNSQSIFINTGSSLNPANATIILGVVQLVSNSLTPFVIERAGRKIILLISSLGMAISLIALGTFFYIQVNGNPSYFLWVPMPALIMFNIFFGFGFGPLPWAILSEIFPSNIKPFATSLSFSCTAVMIFITTRWFPELNAMGAYYPFWIFGGSCILSMFFVHFVVIETKGLSLQMIQEKLQSLY